MLTAMAARAFPYPPAYRARTAWGPLSAVIAAAVIFAGVAIAGFGVVVVVNRGQPMTNAAALWIEFLAQLAIVALTILAAGRFGGRARDALALNDPPKGLHDLRNGLLAVAAVSGVYTLITSLIFPQDIVRDLRPLWEIMQSQWWWILVLVAVIGAPLSEEILFRGFLLSALAKSRIGYANAAIFTTAAWTALHASYSIVGLGEVFLVGLVLSWLLWQTGSLWVPILCHAAYNGAVITFLAAFPVPA